jgi:hypothetical protein
MQNICEVLSAAKDEVKALKLRHLEVKMEKAKH